MSRTLNLARRPFVNRRPVVRLALVLWVVGSLLLVGNVWLYWDFLVGRGDVHARRTQVEEAIRAEERRIAALEEELATFDLPAQNRQVEYLNQRIVRRQFSWSRLFDELEEVLPRDVRIERLSPVTTEGEGRRRARRPSRRPDDEAALDQVLLRIDAQSRSNEAILELVDALWADPDFERPNLLQQSEIEGGLVRFQIETIYDSPAPDPAVPAEDPDGEPRLDEQVPTGRGPVPLRRPASSPPELS